jgi:ribosomal protein L13E
MSKSNRMVRVMKKNIKPLVNVQTTRGHKTREGRGFSLEEIKRAGLTLDDVKLEVPVDKRRRTAHTDNIQTLKEHFTTSIPLTAIKGIGEAIQAELEKVAILDAHDLANANIKILADKVSHSEKTLKRWQNEAEKMLKRAH